MKNNKLMSMCYYTVIGYLILVFTLLLISKTPLLLWKKLQL